MTIKYTTLTQLAEAFKSGELDKREYFLLIDKGGNSLYLRRYSGELTDDEIDKEHERCEQLFRREYGNPVQELLTLAGINSEHC